MITEKIEILVDGIANEASFDKFSLFLGGANTNCIQENHLPDMRGYFPKNYLIYLKDAGHWLYTEQPHAVI